MMNEIMYWWLATGLIIVVVMLALGFLINRQFLGVLIDSRGKMSLSRLQLVLWTWLLVSCFLAIALARKTMNIDMDSQLWALMGISLGSATGSVIIKGVKEAKKPDPEADAVKNAKLGEGEESGLIKVNPPCKDASSVENASLVDMFKGEEIIDYRYIDISKVQMFFFTIAAWVGYASSLWYADLTPVGSDETIFFPKLSQSLLTLIGISHVGYLTVKSAPKTPVKK